MASHHFASGTDPQPPLLNDAQLRHMEVFVTMLQDSLAEVETMGVGSVERSDALQVRENDLPPGFGSRVGPLLTSLRMDIQRLADLLEIKPRRRSLLRRLRAVLTSQIVRLDDSYPGRLGGYGRVNPEASPRIDPLLDAIRANLLEILAESKRDLNTVLQARPAPDSE